MPGRIECATPRSHMTDRSSPSCEYSHSTTGSTPSTKPAPIRYRPPGSRSSTSGRSLAYKKTSDFRGCSAEKNESSSASWLRWSWIQRVLVELHEGMRAILEPLVEA